eukprot:SAG22_NODE_490_length_9834_cov_7.723780_5_plen_123_part_00
MSVPCCATHGEPLSHSHHLCLTSGWAACRVCLRQGCHDQFDTNGTRIPADGNGGVRGYSPGLAAMNAVAALASNSSVAWEHVDRLWGLAIPAGDDPDSDRYYSGSLYLEALLHLSGRYRAWL